MRMNFDLELASALQDIASKIHADKNIRATFASDPTEAVVSYLKQKGISIPEKFHAHAVHRGNPLPEEPLLATVDRYIYIFRKDGLFEFKQVPGSPDGNDAIMDAPLVSGACACCNCCAIEV